METLKRPISKDARSMRICLSAHHWPQPNPATNTITTSRFKLTSFPHAV